MATRYIYNGEKYNSLYALRQAIGRTQRITYGDLKTAEEFASIGVTVEVEEYDPLDEIPLEGLRSQRMMQMKQTFEQYRVDANTKITSSLGFMANANITAFSDVDGCIAQLEQTPAVESAEDAPTITFMDFDNQAHSLTLEQLKTLKAEIAENGSRAYALKWQYRTQIQEANRDALKKMTVFAFDAE